MEKNNKKVLRGWYMYDWANSVYNLVITSAIFPIYYNAQTTTEEHGDQVMFLGHQFTNTSLYSFTISLSFLLIALMIPVLSGVADYGGRKRLFLKLFCYMGAIACMGLFFFDSVDTLAIGLVCSMFASMGFAGSQVFYNSYLPVIATEDKFDKVSATGFAFGYGGSVILLIANLIFVMFHESFGVTSGLASRLSFVSVGIWWMGFAQITFNRMPVAPSLKKAGENLITKGYSEIRKVLGELKGLILTKRFLIAFFFYNMGVQTIMLLAVSFGDKELKLDTSILIGTILILQFVAIGGAYLFSFLSKRKGNITAIMYSVAAWIVVCLVAYFVNGAAQFIMLAVLVGTMMGAVQSLSRSTYAKFIPRDTENYASYFSFYDVVDKVSVVVGTLCYGIINEWTGNMRWSSVSLSVFFVMGLILLTRIPSKHIYNVRLRPQNEDE